MKMATLSADVEILQTLSLFWFDAFYIIQVHNICVSRKNRKLSAYHGIFIFKTDFSVKPLVYQRKEATE